MVDPLHPLRSAPLDVVGGMAAGERHRSHHGLVFVSPSSSGCSSIVSLQTTSCSKHLLTPTVELVQTVLRDDMISETQHVWMQRAVRTINVSFPTTDKVTSWTECERLLPHALFCATWIEQAYILSEEAAHLFAQTAHYLLSHARYGEAEPLLKKAFVICKQLFGIKDPRTAISLDNLATLYMEQGKYKVAESLFKRALAICERVLGPVHLDTADALDNLALLYWNQGKYREAEPLYKRALAICNQAGTKAQYKAKFNNLALLYLSQENYKEAELLFGQALAICEQEYGPLHPHTAQCLNNLAGLYLSQGKYEKAKQFAQQARTVREQVLPPIHPAIAQSLNSLAVIYHLQEKEYKEAELLFRQALSIYEQALPPMHLETAVCLKNLAEFFVTQRKYKEAELLFKQALSIYEQALPPAHPDIAMILTGYAELYWRQGEYWKPESLLERALTICKQTLGANNPITQRVFEHYTRVKNAQKYALSFFILINILIVLIFFLVWLFHKFDLLGWIALALTILLTLFLVRGIRNYFLTIRESKGNIPPPETLDQK